MFSPSKFKTSSQRITLRILACSLLLSIALFLIYNTGHENGQLPQERKRSAYKTLAFEGEGPFLPPQPQPQLQLASILIDNVKYYQNVSEIIKEIKEDVKRNLESFFDSLDRLETPLPHAVAVLDEKLSGIQELERTFIKSGQDLSELPVSAFFGEFVVTLQRLICSLSFDVVRTLLNSLSALQVSKSIEGSLSSEMIAGCTVLLAEARTLLQNEREWLVFLSELWATLSGAGAQVRDDYKLGHWTLNRHFLQYTFELEQDLQEFLQNFAHVPAVKSRGPTAIRKWFNVNGDRKRRQLKQLLDTTLTLKYQVEVDDISDLFVTSIIVQGNFVVLSKLIEQLNSTTRIGIITILAMHTVFIDGDLVTSTTPDSTSRWYNVKNVTIIAPNWWHPDGGKGGLNLQKNSRIPAINAFKQRASRVMIENWFLTPILGQFLQELDSSAQVTSRYTTNDLVQELFGLHWEMFRGDSSSERRFKFLPRFHSLLNRTRVMFNRLPEPKGDRENRAVIQNLVAATVATIVALRAVQDSSITDVKVQDRIRYHLQNARDLKTMQNNFLQRKMVESQKSAFFREIGGKIGEVTEFMDTTILPENFRVQSEIHQAIEALLEEISSLKLSRLSEERNVVLPKKEAFLHRFRRMNVVFGVLNATTQILVFVGQKAKAVAEVLNSGIGFPQIMPTNVIIKIPTSLQNARKILVETLDPSSIMQLEKLGAEVKGQKFGEVLQPMLSGMRENTVAFSQGVSGLEVGKWKVPECLKDLQNLVQQFFTFNWTLESADLNSDLDLNLNSDLDLNLNSDLDLNLNSDLDLNLNSDLHYSMRRSFENINDALTTIVSIFERLDYFGDQCQLTQLMAGGGQSGVESESESESKFRNPLIVDPKLRVASERLENSLLSMLILWQYEKANALFKSWTFPCAPQIVQELDLGVKQSLEFFDVLPVDPVDLYRAVNKALNDGHYSPKILGCPGHVLMRGSVQPRPKGPKPIFLWQFPNNSRTIRDLFHGKKVVLMSHLGYSYWDKIALKFSRLDLYLTPNLEKAGKGESGETELSKSLKKMLQDNFKVRMRHMGNSYYRFNGKIYTLNSPALTLEWSFRKTEGVNEDKGQPVEKNPEYDFLAKDDWKPVLSPYTTWELEFVPLDIHQNSSPNSSANVGVFERLTEFAHLPIDVELAGEITYLLGEERDGVFALVDH